MPYIAHLLTQATMKELALNTDYHSLINSLKIAQLPYAPVLSSFSNEK